MRPWRAACALALALVLVLALVACRTAEPPSTPSTPGSLGSLTKDFRTAGGLLNVVNDSVYLSVDRKLPPPVGYGLYTVLLTRAADRNTLRVLSELFVTTGSAGEAALARANLNLILIPVKSAAEARRFLEPARSQPEATAAALMQGGYDYGQAALLMAAVCHPARGAAVMQACGSQSPEGPLLVTTLRPLDGTAAPGQPLLVVNLSTTPTEALREVLAAYRRQIQRKDYTDRVEIDAWRLVALNHLLDAARLLPGISKAYAGGR